MTSRYVHTLLFACPSCNLPIAISHISEQGNVEAIEESIRIKCSHCSKSSNVIAIIAKRHYVDEWPYHNYP